jgi:hypothetical protein
VGFFFICKNSIVRLQVKAPGFLTKKKKTKLV